MKTFGPSAIILGALLVNASTALADPVTRAEVDSAQAQMITRVYEAVDRYAAEIGMDSSYVIYCRNDMYLRSFNHPANGHIPFGVNYNKITDSQNLKLVLSVREAYERSFLVLCLANAKNALRQAKQP